jgi:hypothetical protein
LGKALSGVLVLSEDVSGATSGEATVSSAKAGVPRTRQQKAIGETIRETENITLLAHRAHKRFWGIHR